MLLSALTTNDDFYSYGKNSESKKNIFSKDIYMTLKRSLIISISIHLLLSMYLILPKYSFSIDFDIKQGISSLAVNIKESRKSPEKEKDRINPESPKELSIIISPFGFFDVAYADPKKKEDPEKLDSDEKNSRISKKVIGALCKKATYLSQNQPPEYPYLARKLGYQGKVTLGIQVLPTGDTGDIQVLKSSGFDILDTSALEAAKRWRFFEEGKVQLPEPVLITKGLEFVINNKR